VGSPVADTVPEEGIVLAEDSLAAGRIALVVRRTVVGRNLVVEEGIGFLGGRSHCLERRRSLVVVACRSHMGEGTSCLPF